MSNHDRGHASTQVPVKSAERTVRILEILAASPTPMSATELHEVCGYPRTSLLALIGTLTRLRWIMQDESGLRYGIGTHALLAAKSSLDRDPVIEHAQFALESLHADTTHTAQVARRDRGTVLYLATRHSQVYTRRPHRVERRRPAHIAAAGHALLAQLSAADVCTLVPADLEQHTATGHAAADTITDHDAFLDELSTVRERGWAIERGRGTDGLAYLATAIPYRTPAVDAIGICFPAAIADDCTEVERLAEILVRHACAFADALAENTVGGDTGTIETSTHRRS